MDGDRQGRSEQCGGSMGRGMIRNFGRCLTYSKKSTVPGNKRAKDSHHV